MNVVVEKQWISHGLTCEVKWVMDRHRCGYVTVPPEHPWHGIGYDEPAPTEPLNPATDLRVGEDIGIVSVFCYALAGELGRSEYERTPEFQIAIHGGLTHSRANGGGWTFGFDCAYADDTPTTWTLERVAEETERLAAQLAQVAVPA